MCYKINDFEPHCFSNFLIFSSQDNDDGHERGGVAKDAGGKEEKGIMMMGMREVV